MTTMRHAQSSAFLLAGAAAAGAGVYYYLTRRRVPEEDRDHGAPAAFVCAHGHAGGAAPTRDAGPDFIRDEDGADWDHVDQSVDESFPASDPPSANRFT